MPRRLPRCFTARLLLALAPVLWASCAAAYCDDAADDRQVLATLPDPQATRQGRAQLAALMRAAVVDSPDVRSAEHARRAADFELQQTQASGRPQISLNGQGGLGQSTLGPTSYAAGTVASAGISASMLLYDGGKLDALTGYRRQLADAGGSAIEAARERVAREAVLTVLERNRFRLQYRAHQQYVAKLACLSRSIEQIVARDRGRASELLQARKSQRQAEIARDEALASLRQNDARLRLLVGDNVEPWTAIGAPLAELPGLDQVSAQIQDSADLRQLRQQAEAQERLVQVSAADRAAQLRWQIGANASHSARIPNSQNSSWIAGVALNYTLDDGGAVNAATDAARERAESARRALDAALRERLKQAGTLHDAAGSAFQRARSYGDVLRDSDRLRNATYEQWAKLGRRSLFDLISAENDYSQLRLAHVNALYDGLSASAQLRNAGTGLLPWLAADLADLPAGSR